MLLRALMNGDSGVTTKSRHKRSGGTERDKLEQLEGGTTNAPRKRNAGLTAAKN